MVMSSTAGGMLPSVYHERLASSPGQAKRGIKDSEQSMPHLNRKKSRTVGAGNNTGISSRGKDKDSKDKDSLKNSSSSAYTRGMFLAFVDNALAERRLVRVFYDSGYWRVW